MNLMDLFIRVGIDDQATGKIGGITGSFSKVGDAIGKGIATAAKVGTAALTAVGTAAVGVAKASIDAYAEYEQLVGGAQLMFGEAYEFVASKSANAYKTVQMSQNDYLQQMNGFATGLKTALNGDEQAAAELADRVLQAEADVVAATGNTQEAVQNAFNGIMKSNFTMLDNLQLGITPTKEGFQELIASVNDWNAANGKSTKYTIGNLADMQSALVDYIEMQGLAGYASKEASQTISGSVAAMKGSWQNLMVGMSDDSQSIDVLVDNFADSVETVADNIFPVVERLVPRMGEAFTGLLRKGFEALDMDFSVEGVKDKIGDVFVSACEKLDIEPSFEGIKSKGLELLDALGSGVEEGMPEATGKLLDGLIKGLEFTEEHGPDLIKAGGDFLNHIIDGMQASVEVNGDKMSGVIEALNSSIEANAEQLAYVGGEIMGNIIDGMIDAGPIDWGKVLFAGTPFAKAAEGVQWAQGVWDSFYDGLQSKLGGGAAEDMGNLEIGVDIIADTSAYTEATTEAKTQTDTIFSAPIHVSADFGSVVSEAQSVYSSVASVFAAGVTMPVKAEVDFGSYTAIGAKKAAQSGIIQSARASGLDYVPFDGYVSMLHKGEAVLTANQAKKWRDGASGGVTIVQHINSVPQTPVQLAAATAAYFERARW